MARSISTAAIDAIAAGACIVSGALRIMTPAPQCIWGGFWDLSFDGYTYTGLGEPELARGPSFAIGASEIGMTIAVSSLHPELVPAVLEQDMRGAAVVQHRLFFDQHGTTLLHAEPWFRGKVDNVPVSDVPGGAGTIRFKLEGVLRGLGRSGGRLTADQDQRLVDADDGSHRYVSTSGELVLYHGSGAPLRASGLNGGAAGAFRSGSYGRVRPS